LFILRSSPMSARIIYMKKAPAPLAVEQIHDTYVPVTMAEAYVKLVYCIAAWHDQDAAHRGENRRDP
jgi:hypothetical protein